MIRGHVLRLLGVLIACALASACWIPPPRRTLLSESTSDEHGTSAQSPVDVVAGKVRVTLASRAQQILVRTTRDDQCAYDVAETVPGYPHHRGPIRREWRTCPAAAPYVRVQLTLPDGTTLEATTDAHGYTAVEPPKLVPDVSEVTAVALPARSPDEDEENWTEIPQPSETDDTRAPAIAAVPALALAAPTAPRAETPREREPVRERAGLSIVRDAIVACGGKQRLRGMVQVTLKLAGKARISAVRVDRSRLQRCIETRLVGEHLPIARPAGDLVFPYAIR